MQRNQNKSNRFLNILWKFLWKYHKRIIRIVFWIAKFLLFYELDDVN
jgi:hypothetical protein